MSTVLRWTNINKYLLLAICLIPQIAITFPAYALKISLGVVKSRENSAQWGEITNRLKATGIDYCTLDSVDWQDISDLNNIRVLMLPNISNLNGAQVETLNTWTKKGGKLIVTGPTGILAPSDVRSQLKEVVGASWGFTNSTPSSLQIEDSQKESWGKGVNKYSNLVGGVLVPSETTQTEIVAIWINEGRLPGVISTSESVYLGWRWGEDRVSPANLDTSWLQAALNHYGINGSNSLLPESDSRLCTEARPRQNENFPVVPDIEKESFLKQKKNNSVHLRPKRVSLTLKLSQ